MQVHIHEYRRIAVALSVALAAALAAQGLLAVALAAQETPAPGPAAGEPVARFRVLKPDGTPLAGVEVQVQHYKGLKGDRDLSGERLKITTEADGGFTRLIGAGGTWRINLLAPGVGWILTERFEVTAGQPLEQALTLRPGATLSGRVLDADTGQPVVKGWVNLYSDEDTMSGYPQLAPWSGPTDAEGRWKLATVPDGRWSLGAGGSGYIFGSRARVLTVRDGKGEEGIDLALRRGAAIKALLLKPDGTPLVETKLSLDVDRMREDGSGGSRGGGRHATDAEGWATVDGLQDGAWRLRVCARGVGYAFSDTVEAKAAEGPVKLTVQLRKGMRVSGRVVVAGTDRPVDQASVYLRPVDSETPRAPLGSIRCDASGRWEQTDVPPGRYVVVVQKMAYVPWQSEINVAEGQDVAGLTASLAPPVEVRGVVLSPDGRTPVPGAVVRCQGSTAAADAQGRFAIVVPPGGATLAVSAAGYAVQEAQVMPGEGPQAREERIVLTTRGSSVSGSVLNIDTRQPVAGQDVLLAKYQKDDGLDAAIQQGDLGTQNRGSIDAFGNLRGNPVAVTDAAGQFRMEDVAPGEYLALVFPAVGVALASKPFTVAEGRPTVGIDFQVTRRPMGYVVIRILGSDGQPLAGKYLWFSYRDDRSGVTGGRLLGPEGLFYRSMEVPGTIRVTVAVEAYAIGERTAVVKDINGSLAMDFTLAPEKADAVLTGRVLLPDGKTPAADVLVTPWVPDRTWPESRHGCHWRGKHYSFLVDRSVRTAADGTFRIERLRPGRYGVQASPLKGLWQWNEPAREELAMCLPALGSRQVELAESGQTDGLEVTLGQGGAVEGQLVDATTGAPVDTARELRVIWDGGGLFGAGEAPLPSMWQIEAKPDAEGRFRIRGLPPGAYRVRVSAEGYQYYNQSGWKGVKIKANQTEQRIIRLEPR